VELTRLLYRRAIASVRDARRYLATKNIMERGKSINHAYLVLSELICSLNKEEAPELSNRLGGLYVYMQSRLLEANMKQIDAPLADVLGLLNTLAEAWEGVAEATAQPEPPARVAAANPWAQPAGEEQVRVAISA
jgi:flagellar protein FliS